MGELQEIVPGSHQEFITEHYWGYTADVRGCSEYQVEHPRWRIWPGLESRLEAEVGTLYGAGFVEGLGAAPASAFIADGSSVIVRGKTDLNAAMKRQEQNRV